MRCALVATTRVTLVVLAWCRGAALCADCRAPGVCASLAHALYDTLYSTDVIARPHEPRDVRVAGARSV